MAAWISSLVSLGVFAGLLLADEREAFGVEQQEVDEALAGPLKVVTDGIKIR